MDQNTYGPYNSAWQVVSTQSNARKREGEGKNYSMSAVLGWQKIPMAKVSEVEGSHWQSTLQ